MRRRSIAIAAVALALPASSPVAPRAQPAALVLDIFPGPTGSMPSELTPLGDKIVFAATDDIAGRELWTSDGTQAGTRRLIDLLPGLSDSSPNNLRRLGDGVFFAANGGASGVELWRTNGTVAGTTLVLDIFPGSGPELPNSSRPQSLLVAGDFIYFSAESTGVGRELWRSNGSPSQTTIVKDIRPGVQSSIPFGGFSLAHLNGKVFFAADDGVHGNEPWVTDGTEAGTMMIVDLNPGPASSIRSGGGSFAAAGGNMYFEANDGTTAFELWKTDGTVAGTTLVRELVAGPFGNVSPPIPSIEFMNELFFVYHDGGFPYGRELWRTDGTAAGTRIVRDLWDGSGSSNPRLLTKMGGDLYFAAFDAFAGVGFGEELWRTDGTTTDTLRVRDINPGLPGARITDIATYEDRLLFFGADDGESGVELWISDGATSGTSLLQDLRPGPESARPEGFAVLDNRLFFTADDGFRGRELWMTRLGPARLIFAGGALDFGSRFVNSSISPPMSIELRNDGGADLLFIGPGVEVVGPGADQFFLLDPPPTRIAPGATLNVRLVFVASRVGSMTARLRIVTNDAEQPQIEVPLSGVGLAPLAARHGLAYGGPNAVARKPP
jgi:ELWxxDGT repeat protein